jgi:hypothetical protein
MIGMYAESKPTREQRQRNTPKKIQEPLLPSTTINEFFKRTLSYICQPSLARSLTAAL